MILQSLDIHSLRDKYIVVKYGGAAMECTDVRQAVCEEIANLSLAGLKIVVVHGGGKGISRLLERLGVAVRFVDGLRVTDAETMTAVEMVLSGSLNKDLVSRITRAGAPALGFSGRDAHILEAALLTGAQGEDLGLTGEVTRVDPQAIEAVLQAGLVPVISPVGESVTGQPLNLNADYAAAALAGALNSELCIFLTDVSGVKKGGVVIPRLTPGDVSLLIKDGTISGGMIPKVQCALRAIESGCKSSRICDASSPGTLFLRDGA